MAYFIIYAVVHTVMLFMIALNVVSKHPTWTDKDIDLITREVGYRFTNAVMKLTIASTLTALLILIFN